MNLAESEARIRDAADDEAAARQCAEAVIMHLSVTLVVPFRVDRSRGRDHLNGIGAVVRKKPEGSIEPAPIFKKVMISLSDEHSLAALAYSTGRAIEAPEVKEDPRAKQWLARLTGSKSVFAVPIMADGRPVGSMIVGDTEEGREFARKEQDYALDLAAVLGERWAT